MPVYDIEAKIIREVAQAVLDRGFYIRAHDGEEFAGKKTRVLSEFMANCGDTDETTLFAYVDGIPGPTGIVGWVRFIHGNGEDVLSDCSGEGGIASIVDEYLEAMR